jgi:hypothetical protein
MLTQRRLTQRFRPPSPAFLREIIIASIIFLVIMHNTVEARFKRCFTCRSRGALGDCRDPFSLNSTTFDGQTNVKPSIEAVPCASGWCAKIIEDDYGDSIAATERSCMTRPPTDNEERCSETVFENHRDRKVFLCMCYGDLCNSATRNGITIWLASAAIMTSMLIVSYHLSH